MAASQDALRRNVIPLARAHARAQPRPVPASGHAPRIGLIHNERARHNIGRHLPLALAGFDRVMPATHDELHDVLAGFVADGVDSLIVDGGDGTVRDVLSVIARDFPWYSPRIALVPSGKTNALACDLGIDPRWTLAEAVDAIVHGRVAERTPIEVRRGSATRPDLAGFIFGTAAFVQATKTAQTTHRLGAFNGLAVGLSIAAAIGQTVFGGSGNRWRRGERMRVAVDGGDAVEAAHYLFLASSLERMPLGLQPFGRPRAGLKLLRVEAPAQRIARALPALLRGSDAAWLPGHGYHRGDAARIDVSLDEGFVLDGEIFAGGDLTLRLGRPISFFVP